MNLLEYYRVLELRQGASDDEIKKAYRKKAMEFHPDRNSSPDAQEMFIRLTEAYEYLTSHPHGRNITEEEVRRNYQAWVDYRRAEARKRAETYARASYAEFKKSQIYKSTTVIDGTMVFLGLILAVSVIFMSVYGYHYRMKMAVTSREEPSLSLAALTFIIGCSYLVISLLYLSAWVGQKRKKLKNNSANVTEKENKESV